MDKIYEANQTFSLKDVVLKTPNENIIATIFDSVVYNENIIVTTFDSLVHNENIIATIFDSVVHNEKIIAPIFDSVVHNGILFHNSKFNSTIMFYNLMIFLLLALLSYLHSNHAIVKNFVLSIPIIGDFFFS